MGWADKARQRALQEAPSVVLDRYGREITEGCEIALIGPTVGGIIVQGIAPVLDPKLPPGTLRMRAQCFYEFYLTKGQANPTFLRIRTTEEMVAAGIVKVKPEAQIEMQEPEVGRMASRESNLAPEETVGEPETGPKVAPLISEN